MIATLKHDSLGFSLTELVATLAIIGVLAGMAMGSFGRLIAELRISSNVSNLVHILHLARQLSWTTGQDVVLCDSTSGTQCSNAGNWHTGWLLFSNLDQDDPPRADPGEPVHQAGGPVANATITANRRAFVMRPFGRRSTNGTLTYCDKRGAPGARAVIVSYTGKARISREQANGDSLSCSSTDR